MRLANIMLLLILTSGLTGFPGRVLACSEVFSSSSQNPDLPSMRDVQLSILQTLTLLRHKAYIQNDRVRLSSEDMNEPTEVRAVIKLQSLAIIRPDVRRYFVELNQVAYKAAQTFTRGNAADRDILWLSVSHEMLLRSAMNFFLVGEVPSERFVHIAKRLVLPELRNKFSAHAEATAIVVKEYLPLLEAQAKSASGFQILLGKLFDGIGQSGFDERVHWNFLDTVKFFSQINVIELSQPDLDLFEKHLIEDIYTNPVEGARSFLSWAMVEILEKKHDDTKDPMTRFKDLLPAKDVYLKDP